MNNLSPQLLQNIFAQESRDPFLFLITLDHEEWDGPIYLVNNTKNFTSRGNVFAAFPMKIRLPVDDGETARSFAMEFDNVSLELINEIRSVTSPIGVTMELVLASMPDTVQMAQPDLKIQNITYNRSKVTATVVLDTFLNTAVTSEIYSPSNFPGLF